METKKCYQCQKSFLIDSDELGYYEKMGVQVPRLCPDCRSQRRTLFRNERAFYKHKCDKCGKDSISMYSPDKTFPVYCYDCWFSEDWDGSSYAKEYDSSRPFFDQWKELFNTVPKPALVAMRSVNCHYLNFCADNKNCYMVVESSNNEDCTHCYWIQKTKNCIDTSYAHQTEFSYDTDDVYNSTRVFYSRGVYDCLDSYFLLHCRNCTDCIGCVNLRNQSNCIFNTQYTKEEYEKKKAELRLDTASGVEKFRKEFDEFKNTFPSKYAEIYNSVNSTGNYITHAKNVQNCFHSYESEDCKHSIHVWRGVKDCMDCNTVGRAAEKIYNTLNTGLEGSNVICGFYCWSSNFVSYSFNCPNSTNLFGCVGMRKKSYAILNKTYEKDEYEKIKNHIIEELKNKGVYGEFFPAELSPFGYNETSAIDEFPLTKAEALAQGFRWEDYPRGTYDKGTIEWENVPDSIKEIGTIDAVKEIFTCTNCTKNYRIIDDELTFYSRLEIPLPRWCPECRFKRRVGGRNPHKLWKRSCSCAGNQSTNAKYKNTGTHFHVDSSCPNEFETSYAPNRPEIVYCEQCYQSEVV